MAKARITFDVTDPQAPVFVISVAAELTGMHPQTLRTYDRIGLVSPGRAVGGGRRYSLHDLDRLRTVADLTSVGIGIEGVRRILELEVEVDRLRAMVATLEVELNRARQALMHLSPANLPAVRAASDLTQYHPAPPGHSAR